MRKLLCLLIFSFSLFATEVSAQCQADFSYLANGLTVNFTDSSFTQNRFATDYFWDFGTGAIATNQNPTYTYSAPGTYFVCLTVFDSIANCTDSICKNITIVNQTQPCMASFSYSAGANNTVSFNGTANGGVAPYFYAWSFGDGSTISGTSNPVHTYGSAGMYVANLSVTDSVGTRCNFQDTVVISSPPCMAGFSYMINNDSLFIQNTATNYSNIQYSFGDSTFSNQPNPIHIYSQSGTYVLCQTISDSSGCSDTFCDTVTINITPPCSAGFTFNQNGFDVMIRNSVPQFTTILYDFGDGTTSSVSNPMHTYNQNGTYVICQTITNGNCVASFCDTVTINVPPPCVAAFTYNLNQGVLQIQNQAVNFNTISYDFGDGGTTAQANPSYTYAQSGTYVVCQTVGDTATNCSSTFCDTIQVYITPPCMASFTDTTINDTTHFTTTASSFNRVLYDFGDGNSSTDIHPIHQYQNSGTYTVTQFVFNDTTNCVDSIQRTLNITVSFSCVAKFELALDTNQLGTLFLVNTSSSDNTHEYLWDFGDGTTSIVRLPTHQYDSNKRYNICLTVYDSVQNCSSTFCTLVGLDSNGNILKSNGFKVRVIDGTFIGIEEVSLFDELNVYPNPANEQITVELANEGKEINYEIFNINGSILLSGQLNTNRSEIQLSSLKKGIYFLRVRNKDDTAIKKIIKNQ